MTFDVLILTIFMDSCNAPMFVVHIVIGAPEISR